MSHTFSQLVWLGADTATEPADILNSAAQITLFEAREAACKKLQQKFPQDNVTIHQTVLTPTKASITFTEYNLAEFSAIQTATGLKKLFPGLRPIASEQLTGTAVSDAIDSLALTDNNNLLIIDIADSSLALLKAIDSAKQLRFFSAIYIQASQEALYANAASRADFIGYLEGKGYALQLLNSSDPDLPWLSFGLNPLWSTLQQAQQSNNSLNAELSKVKEQLNKAQQEFSATKHTSDQAITESTKLRESQEQQIAEQLTTLNKAKLEADQQLATIKQQLASAQQELTAANKSKQDAEQQLVTVKQQLSATQQELTKAQHLQTENSLQQALAQKIEKMFADQAQQLTKEVGNIKNHINSGLGNTAKQLEAFMGIQNYLEHGVKPLSFHGWPISPDIGLYIAGLIDENNYDVIIEFGSGTSTVLMAKALISKLRSAQTKTLANASHSSDIAVQDNSFSDLPARIVTFEHNSLYHGKTQKALQDNGVAHLVDLVHAPLVDYQYKDGSQYLYYNCNEKLQELAKIFKGRKANILVLVDGPPGATNKNARFPALPHLLNTLPDHSFTIVMDDYNRAEEKDIVDLWKKIAEERFLNPLVETIPSEKGLSTITLN